MFGLFDDVVEPDPAARSRASRCPAIPCRRPSRSRSTRRRWSGSTPTPIYDLVVSVDDDGRIWLDRTPEGHPRRDRRRSPSAPSSSASATTRSSRSSRPREASTSSTPSSATPATGGASTSTTAASSRARTDRPDPSTHHSHRTTTAHNHHPPITERDPMRSITKPALAAVAAIIAVVALAGCSSRRRRRRRRRRRGRHLHRSSLVADPGALDPQASAVQRPVRAVAASPTTRSSASTRTARSAAQLAKEWSLDGHTVTLTLNEGITCSDGSEFTAQTAADNITWIGDPENQSPFLGAFLPRRHHGRGRRQHPDPHARGAGALRPPGPVEPPHGLRRRPRRPHTARRRDPRHRPVRADRGRAERPLHLRGQRGLRVGPRRRDHRRGGPARHGRPRASSPNETTAANLLLSGEINAAADRRPRRASGSRRPACSRRSTPALLGEQWYNHDRRPPDVRPGGAHGARRRRSTSPSCRRSLTSGQGGPATRSP